MSELFLTVLNMSLTASYVIIFVILIRLFLKKAPKVISYALWVVVAFRLIIPFSYESIFSLMPRSTNAVPIPHDIIYQQSPKINSGIEVVDSFVSQSLPAPTAGASANPLQIYVEIGAYIWVLGIIALLVYSLVSILILKRQLKSAQLIEQNIFEAKNLKTSFVLGLINPKIYLPVGLNATERSYILLHEQTHIHRKDHIIKVLAFLTLSVHWFNPLVWIAFILMSKDMELSCDERVLKEMNEDIKKPYANSLLLLATERHILNGSPLAFGEGNVKGRIKNVLNYKKPRFWIIVISIIVVTVVGIGLMANPLSKEGIFNNVLNQDGYTTYEIQKPITFTAYIESTSIPKNENEVIELNKEIGKVGKVGILLESVMHRGNDIYFNFDAKQFINNDRGEFLYNAILNEDGTATSYNLSDAFNIYNKNTKIDVGQRGFGPGSKFSFGIDIENYDVIKDGFTLEYKGSILYGYSLEEIGDRNGFGLTDQEVGRMLGYSSAYCFSTYEMDNGLYIVGFLADGKTEHSDIGAGLFQFKDGEYKLISQTIHKEQALEQDRIVQGMLIAPSNNYYDVILSNNENLAEIRRTSGGKVISEKVDRVNPNMTVIKLSETLSDTTYTFYDATGQQINSYFTSSGSNVIDQGYIKPTAPKLSLDQIVGVDMVQLDYASNDIVIFHDYFGLFVYDLNSLQIVRSLDLKPLNCHQTQGDNYCDVSVSLDGNTVQLHPMSSENMYVYTISDNALKETAYMAMENPFRSEFVPIEEVINSTKLGNHSHHAVLFDTGEYGYLHSEDGKIGTLSYVRGDMKYILFEKE